VQVLQLVVHEIKFAFPSKNVPCNVFKTYLSGVYTRLEIAWENFDSVYDYSSVRYIPSSKLVFSESVPMLMVLFS